jgi:hypothetical protein
VQGDHAEALARGAARSQRPLLRAPLLGKHGAAIKREKGPASLVAAGQGTNVGYAVAAPTIVDRNACGASALNKDGSSSRAPRDIVVHRAAGFQASAPADGKRRTREIQKLHQSQPRGCADVGYHFVIDAAWAIFQGCLTFDGDEALDERPRFAVGAHALSQKRGEGRNLPAGLLPPASRPLLGRPARGCPRSGGPHAVLMRSV